MKDNGKLTIAEAGPFYDSFLLQTKKLCPKVCKGRLIPGPLPPTHQMGNWKCLTTMFSTGERNVKEVGEGPRSVDADPCLSMGLFCKELQMQV